MIAPHVPARPHRHALGALSLAQQWTLCNGRPLLQHLLSGIHAHRHHLVLPAWEAARRHAHSSYLQLKVGGGAARGLKAPADSSNHLTVRKFAVLRLIECRALAGLRGSSTHPHATSL